MGRLTTFAVGTAVAHVLLTIAVYVHGRRTDREPGKWLVATLLFGLLGVAGYLLDR